MTLLELKKLKWIPVKNWSELTTTYFDEGSSLVTKKNIDKFVMKVFENVSKKLNIRSSALIPILKYENYVFYEELEFLFEKYQALSLSNEELLNLEKLLIIPVN